MSDDWEKRKRLVERRFYDAFIADANSPWAHSANWPEVHRAERLQYDMARLQYDITVERQRALLQDAVHELGDNHPALVYPLTYLADQYSSYRWDTAEKFYIRAISIWEQHDPDNWRIAQPLNNLGVLDAKHGDFKQAEFLIERALQVEEKYGGENPRLRNPLINLRYVYHQQGKADEGEAAYQRVKEIEKNYGVFLVGFADLSAITFDVDPYNEAKAAYKQALAEKEQQNPKNAQSRAWQEIKQRLSDDWEPLMPVDWEELKRRAQSPFYDAFITDANWPWFEAYKGGPDDHDIAVEKQRALLQDAVHELGDNHPALVYPLTYLADQYSSSRSAVAEQFYRHAIAIWEQHDPDNWRIAQPLNNLGVLYAGQKRFLEARSLIERALQVEEQYGGENPRLCKPLTSLMNIYSRYPHQEDELEAAHQRVKNIEEKYGAASASVSAFCGIGFGIDPYNEAKAAYEQALAEKEQQSRENSPSRYWQEFKQQDNEAKAAYEQALVEKEQQSQENSPSRYWQEFKQQAQSVFGKFTGKSAAVDLQRLPEAEASRSIAQRDIQKQNAYRKPLDVERNREPDIEPEI